MYTQCTDDIDDDQYRQKVDDCQTTCAERVGGARRLSDASDANADADDGDMVMHVEARCVNGSNNRLNAPLRCRRAQTLKNVVNKKKHKLRMPREGQGQEAGHSDAHAHNREQKDAEAEEVVTPDSELESEQTLLIEMAKLFAQITVV